MKSLQYTNIKKRVAKRSIITFKHDRWQEFSRGGVGGEIEGICLRKSASDFPRAEFVTGTLRILCFLFEFSLPSPAEKLVMSS